MNGWTLLISLRLRCAKNDGNNVLIPCIPTPPQTGWGTAEYSRAEVQYIYPQGLGLNCFFASIQLKTRFDMYRQFTKTLIPEKLRNDMYRVIIFPSHYRPGNPQQMCSELEKGSIRVAADGCSVSERPPYQTQRHTYIRKHPHI